MKRVAIILSGGGARGAYEVGVLSYLFEDVTRMLGAPPRIDIVCGTSVGAINGCFFTAHMSDPVLGLRRLVQLWTELELTRVLGFGVRQVVSLPRLALGGLGDGSGLFDVTPMAELISKEISWRAVTRSLRRRHLKALSVSTTEVSTGRTVVFVAVDGRPMGLTPAMGVSVAAGTHTVLLVTDTQRKSTSATCKAGETKTISLRLAL